VRAAWLLVALACGSAARAQERDAGPGPPQRGETAPKPLSKEDEDLLKELPLLERLELLRNLELFEADQEARQAKEAPPPPGDH
jgi:hypothetical protein